MPRTARKQSETGVQHVMLRGINREAVFQDEEDRERFLSVMRKCKAISGFELFAWCLMGNHVHLLIRAGTEPLATVIKRIGCRYVYWYNHKYERIGHLFQDRYRSEPVDTDAYFLVVLRYITQNPIKAGMERRLGEYPFSSYGAYCGRSDGLTDTGFAEGFFDSNEAVCAFLEARGDDVAMDEAPKSVPVKDEVVAKWLKAVSGCRDAEAFGGLDKAKQRACVQEIRQRGASIRQIATVTGLPRSNIGRMVK